MLSKTEADPRAPDPPLWLMRRRFDAYLGA
jgi:hypothetical protein